VIGTATFLFGEGFFVSERKERLFFEPINLVDTSDVRLAFDVGDGLSRVDRLSDSLSFTERMQVVEQDEIEQMVAHLAEVGKLKVYPYRQVVRQGMLGSEVVIDGDDGSKLRVFRRVVDFLKAQVIKHPDDARGKMVLDLFSGEIEPFVGQMNIGDTIAFFSPPNIGGKFEFEYGFLYMYRMVGEEAGVSEFECRSVMLDIGWDDYFAVMEGHHARLISEGKGGGAERIMGGIVRFFGDETNDVSEICHEVLRPLFDSDGMLTLFGERTEVSTWFRRKVSEYWVFRQKSLNWLKKEDVTEAFVSGDVKRMREILSQAQLMVLADYQPSLYDEVLGQIDTWGFAQVMLACGLLSFGFGFGSDLNMAIMGIGDWENYLWICEKCGHHNQINTFTGDLKEYCEGCGVSGRC
jgi:hypothetical protein